MTLELFISLAKEFAEGTGVSLWLFFMTLLFALPLGLAAALGRMSKHALIWRPIHYYIMIFRGTPLLLQLVFVFYGPVYIFEGLKPIIANVYEPILQESFKMNRYFAVVLAYALNYAAYFAEIYRGGIQSIPTGQLEAAQVLGFTRRQSFFKVVLPQVIKRITLPMSNEFTTLVKDTALISTLAVVELFRVARSASNTYVSIVPLFVAGAIYLMLNYVVARFFLWFEKKQDYYK
jgi:polar amino acid transport system permease protein